MKIQITIDKTNKDKKVITIESVLNKINVTKLPPVNLNDLFSSVSTFLKDTLEEDEEDEEKEEVPKIDKPKRKYKKGSDKNENTK